MKGRMPFFAALLSAACAPELRDCVVDGDCASGVCLANGHCELASSPRGDQDEPVRLDAGQVEPPDQNGCRPNSDGVVERLELGASAGLSVVLRVASGAAVDLFRDPPWDLSGPLPGDRNVVRAFEPLDGRWFSSSFPNATYAARLSEESANLGVFELRENGLFLTGLVSPEDGSDRTELAYNPPLALLSLPIAAGSTWMTESSVSGLYAGSSANYRETLTAIADVEGELRTGFDLPFRAHRIRIELRRTVLGTTTLIRQLLFVSECFSTVAGVVSRDDDPDPEFSTAREVWRVAP
jgi:hypothetical protein